MSVENAKTVMELVAGKALTLQQVARIGRLYLAAFPPAENPYDPSDPDQVDAYNAWPTADELGQMFLDNVRSQIRGKVVEAARIEYEASVESQAQAEADEL